ncbi:MAG: 3-phosphoshikimate 1-carboxyvinyltransferase [Bacteroidaceae bacterium]|nr:3-phosphoshikimate 1-carboxyvinyltransferase [Bacteroidaceae bacterium]
MIVSASKTLNTCIVLPASKSISNRALVINALSNGSMPIENISDCDDSMVVVAALRDMPRVIDIKAAGTAMRFLTSLLATRPGEEHIITGTERMRNRPISVLVDALRALGADIDYEEGVGYPPLKISGRRLKGGHLMLPGNVSSQYISSLLMIGPTLEQGLTLALEGEIISRPYIDMTLAIMRQYGARAEWVGEKEIRVEPVPYEPIPYYVESDWSAASYWYEMVALSADEEASVVLPGLFEDSLQGDAAVAKMFEPLGVETVMEQGRVLIRKSGRRVETCEWNMLAQPDLAQTIVVTCCMKGVHFRISGLQTLRIKETDRIAALQKELLKYGFVLTAEGDDVLQWNGEMSGQPVVPEHVSIDTYDDHRMAMAFAPIALVKGSVVINNPEVVSKSYPSFWEDMRSAGFNIEK